MPQMIDLVMRINSVQKSSKSDLSSRGKRPFKVFNRRSVYLESLFFVREVSAGIRRGFGEVAAWEAGFWRGCGVEYIESEKIHRKFDVN